MSENNSPELDNFQNPQHLASPWVLYNKLREIDPVHWNALLGGWVITRHKDVLTVLQSKSFSSRTPFGYGFKRSLIVEEQQAVEYIRPYIELSILNMDAPDHTRQRSVLVEAFSAHSVERLRGRIQQIGEAMFSDFQARGHIEVLHEFAYPFLFTVILELLGIPPSGKDLFQTSLSMVAQFHASSDPAPGQLERFAGHLREVRSYLEPLIAERRSLPKEDVLSLLVQAEAQGALSGELEICVVCVQLIFAAHETTANVISNGLLALLQHPAQMDRLKADTELIPLAVEEILRYCNPAQFRPRIALEDYELGGKRILNGQRVFVMLASANYDEECFHNAEELDIGRSKGRIMTFGHGIHYCLGAYLARIELQIVFTLFLQRLPVLRLDTEMITWRPNFILRGVTSLPLTFDVV